MSGPRLSKLQTETRLFVTLCVATCTRHKPTFTDGNPAIGSGLEDPEGPGVDDLLPFEVVPMLYD
ncbi:hypothetical protein SERLADRAFT_396719 [Serpula lacrymans var. lacrymans S7.9]|uniref:Uncharacterized protein n=1 Tax=Serpula lacrymans var. lacrymans (strain S7.9) TaxID=578457 RepID=F8P4U1_SERL9|nr:uncharacterized protein SERLADRAFT_396719 [Serpula lacrymans var. lacrymans S7.9]EGO21628.1 hypothetical protein SERLADRAFT_396719 [Serpula lacrymans var. lacrymans S7.9]